jgi:hypothetical protein
VKVRTKLVLPVLVLGLISVALLIGGTILLNVTRIGSDNYKRIIAGKDLVADVLPPPLYLVESYLLAYEIVHLTESLEQKRVRDRLEALETEFHGRIDHWRMTGQIKDTGTDFFEKLRTEVIPCVDAGDYEKARQLVIEKLRPKFELQRFAVDTLVSKTLRENERLENDAENLVKSRLWIAFSASLPVLFLTILSSVWLANRMLDHWLESAKWHRLLPTAIYAAESS